MAWDILGAEDIDGTTNPAATEKVIYTVQAVSEAFITKVCALNRSGAARTARISVVKNGGSVGGKYYALHDWSLPTDGRPLEICEGATIAAGGFISVQASGTEVNFTVWGEERGV